MTQEASQPQPTTVQSLTQWQPVATIIGPVLGATIVAITAYLTIRNARHLQRNAQLEKRAAGRETRMQDAYRALLAGLFERLYVAIEFSHYRQGIAQRSAHFAAHGDDEGEPGPPVRDKENDRIVAKNLTIMATIHSAYSLVLLMDTNDDRLLRAKSLVEEVTLKELYRLYQVQSQIWKKCNDFAYDMGMVLETQYFDEAGRADRGLRPHRLPRKVSFHPFPEQHQQS